MRISSDSKDNKPGVGQRWRTRASDTKRLVREPGYAREYFPRIFVRAWRTRGGGWYGIGYLVTFLYLEITMTFTELTEAGSAGDFIGSQVIELVSRWLGESVMNMVQAFLWPATVIEWLGGVAGAAVLLGIHLTFEYFIRPLAEAQFPELAEDRIAREEKKQAKKAKKEAKQAAKRAKSEARQNSDDNTP